MLATRCPAGPGRQPPRDTRCPETVPPAGRRWPGAHDQAPWPAMRPAEGAGRVAAHRRGRAHRQAGASSGTIELQLHRDQELFEKAYGYIKQYYW